VLSRLRAVRQRRRELPRTDTADSRAAKTG